MLFQIKTDGEEFINWHKKLNDLVRKDNPFLKISGIVFS